MTKITRKDKKGYVLRRGECQRKDGKYIYQYNDPIGKRRTVYANTLAELRQKEVVIKEKTHKGLDWATASRLTVNNAFDKYIELNGRIKPETKESYIGRFNYHVRNTPFGNKAVASIRFSDVKLFYMYLIKERGLKIGTLKNIHLILHPMFEMLVQDEIIDRNPSKGIIKLFPEQRKSTVSSENEKPPAKLGKGKALTKAQQMALLKFLENDIAMCKYLPLITVMLGTGMRASEICGLRWSDIDFNKMTIKVSAGMKYFKLQGHGKYEHYLSSLKTNRSYRMIPILPEVYSALREAEDEYKKNGGVLYPVSGVKDFVFYNSKHKALNDLGLIYIIKSIIRAYNYHEKENADNENREALFLPDFACHTLRRTFCTRLAEEENKIKVIQYIMGHSQAGTTLDIYVDVQEDMIMEEFAELKEKIKLLKK